MSKHSNLPSWEALEKQIPAYETRKAIEKAGGGPKEVLIAIRFAGPKKRKNPLRRLYEGPEPMHWNP